MFSSDSSGEQGRSYAKHHHLEVQWRAVLGVGSEELVKNTHVWFVSSEDGTGGTVAPDGKVPEYTWQIQWIRNSKICFSFVSLSRLHLVCLFWVVFIWFLLGLTFYSHRFAFASSSVWTGLHLREWILARGLRQCSLLVCLSWGKERAEVNILQLDLWEGIKLPWSLWRELTVFFLDYVGGLRVGKMDPCSLLHHHPLA